MLRFAALIVALLILARQVLKPYLFNNMYPIHQGDGDSGIGMPYDEFSEKFAEVCFEHLKEKRAGGFAFIFYEQNSQVQNIVNKGHGFRALNKLSGKDMTIFYLSNPDVTGERFSEFNREFSDALGLSDVMSVPSIVFFRVSGEEIYDIDIKPLNGNAPFHLLEQSVKNQISEKIDYWKNQGDFSALDPTPLFSLLERIKSIFA